ncbi:hypothetical protein YA0783_25050 [Pseudomonas corrugata]|uniref:hypothetical protein n=1 Tax=Pseudomonas corrugata TaxID=47879 RepID=UPI0018E60851|nr:hypothetical protein [Pseudomonas corrugata]MBI6621559.1 hypothetical protein [Pseudomonas corrugata]MBI6694206.1 hypothetical protein [Pseudomonas corrugata]
MSSIALVKQPTNPEKAVVLSKLTVALIKSQVVPVAVICRGHQFLVSVAPADSLGNYRVSGPSTCNYDVLSLAEACEWVRLCVAVDEEEKALAAAR